MQRRFQIIRGGLSAEEKLTPQPKFEESLIAHLDSLPGFAMRLTGGKRVYAEDMVQETCLRAFKNCKSLRSPEKIKPWLFQILNNAHINEFHRMSREPPVVDIELSEALLESCNPESHLTPEAHLFEQLLDSEIQQALDELPIEFRTAVWLADVEGFSYKEGGFYSAEDAESALDPQKPKEKEEGAFYVWTRAEIDRLLGKESAEIFNSAYGVETGGNALEDPHKVFVGKNILYKARSLDEIAKRFNKSAEGIKSLLAESRAKLFAEREKRPRPHLDDKALVSWNGLMISALARAHQVLGDASYLAAAERSADFILGKLYDSKTKRLMRRYREGEARYDANLEDYAFLTAGLIDLYEADLDIRWLRQAGELTEQQNRLFYDEKNGGFFDTSGKDGSLLFRTKDDYDAAEPAGNSVATMNLLRLAQMLNNEQWRALAERTLALFGGRLKEFPQAMPQMLCALDFHLDKPRQIILAGRREGEDTKRLLREAHARYIPSKIILLSDGSDGQRFLSRHIPFIESTGMLDGKATAYICENYACKLPTSDPVVMAGLLEATRQK